MHQSRNRTLSKDQLLPEADGKALDMLTHTRNERQALSVHATPTARDNANWS